MAPGALGGRLLVATPALDDPNFHRTVVFLLVHGTEGAFGLVLNRPSQTEVAELLPDWAPFAAPPRQMFLGGPVGMDGVVGLGRAGSAGSVAGPSPSVGPGQVLGSVTTVDLNRPPVDAGVDADTVRLFAGSAGWGADQLEAEIAEGAWFAVDAVEDDLLSGDPGDLWRRVLRRQPGELAWYANALGDPAIN